MKETANRDVCVRCMRAACARTGAVVKETANLKKVYCEAAADPTDRVSARVACSSPSPNPLLASSRASLMCLYNMQI